MTKAERKTIEDMLKEAYLNMYVLTEQEFDEQVGVGHADAYEPSMKAQRLRVRYTAMKMMAKAVGVEIDICKVIDEWEAKQ